MVVGSTNRHTQKLTIAIDDLCIESDFDRRVYLVPSQNPRLLDKEADYMSKVLD